MEAVSPTHCGNLSSWWHHEQLSLRAFHLMVAYLGNCKRGFFRDDGRKDLQVEDDAPEDEEEEVGDGEGQQQLGHPPEETMLNGMEQYTPVQYISAHL